MIGVIGVDFVFISSCLLINLGFCLKFIVNIIDKACAVYERIKKNPNKIRNLLSSKIWPVIKYNIVTKIVTLRNSIGASDIISEE